MVEENGYWVCKTRSQDSTLQLQPLVKVVAYSSKGLCQSPLYTELKSLKVGYGRRHNIIRKELIIDENNEKGPSYSSLHSCYY